jgi:hypothetical protein
VVLWQCGGMAVWHYGSLVLWQCGIMVAM